MVVNTGTAWKLLSLATQIFSGGKTDREQIAMLLRGIADEFDPQNATPFTPTINGL